MKISTIDFNDPQAPKELVKSLKETGFAVIKNHPISEDLIKSVYQEWEKFFDSQENINILSTLKLKQAISRLKAKMLKTVK